MKEIKNTPKAPAPVGPYNQATLANGTLYIAGQIPINPATGDIVNTDIEVQRIRQEHAGLWSNQCGLRTVLQ